MLQLLRQLSSKTSGSRELAEAADKLPLAVLEFQSPTAAVLALPVPASARYTSWLLAGMVGSMLLAAGFIKVQQLVTSPGVLVSTAPDTVVQNFNSSAIIRAITVRPGQFVHKGQVLATLDPTYASADLTALTQQAQSYAAQVAQLQAQENGTPYVPDPSNPASVLQAQTYAQQVGQYQATMQYYTQQINQLQTQMNGSKAQAAYDRQRLGIASNIETMRENLQQLQVGSRLDTLSAIDDRVSVQSDLSNAVSAAAATQKQLDATRAQQQSFDQQWKAQTSQQLATALNSLSQAQQQLAKARLNEQLVTLAAPMDAIVQSVAQLSAGGVLAAGQQLVDLAPVNAPFEVQADIDSSESGYVRTGDKAQIKFRTLDSMLYGAAGGTVSDISANSINPQDTAAVQSQIQAPPLPGSPQNLYYQADVSFDVMNLHNVPQGFRLVPGMPVEVDIVVGHQSVLQYFFTKLMPVAFQSMHEP